ncbi:hypothetical protein D9758_010562 [Tetrapyrgos nigripes]|uniref:DUF1295-domain-containing protein n=1 Tax=Tetrapyrgos nigripes TaxID=182062 RepID=A0A8H5D6Y4_9AGAR|nr:hypothetical protein D9758_010562 [Tetrapyrgos nigripes]
MSCSPWSVFGAASGDSRFDKIKKRPRTFTSWMIQATWTFLVGLPVYLSNIAPASVHPPLSPRDYAAFGLFAASFLFENIADYQKSIWRRPKELKQHDEKFISTGLWGVSRHPNGTVALAGASPLFTYLLLTNVSGVPLEKVGDKKFGTDPKWQRYKRTPVPVFSPWGSKS